MGDNAGSQLSRAARKRELLAQLEQQRLELMVEGMRLERRTTSLDRGWRQLVRYKTPLLIAGGGAAWQLLRRPRTALQLGRGALAGYALYRRLRR